jgi:hypothetical protein
MSAGRQDTPDMKLKYVAAKKCRKKHRLRRVENEVLPAYNRSYTYKPTRRINTVLLLAEL